MLPKTVALFLLVVEVARSDLGQGFQNNRNQQGQNPLYNNNNGGGLGQGYNNNDGGLGQGYNNNNGGLGQGYNNNNGGLGQGYNNNNNDLRPGLGQGNNNGQAYPGVGNGGYNGNNQGYSGVGNQNNNGYQNGYAGLGRNDDEYGRNENSKQRSQFENVASLVANSQNNRRNHDDSNRGLTPISEERYKRDLGQDFGNNQNQQGLGQGINQPQGLGQAAPQPQGLGQGINQPQGLGQGLGNNQGDLGESLGGSLRKKRYSEREPYRKTCNTYYGKFICYRLYESSASIPNDFTCWQTYLGKRNCTETENILYLDRRNVEVDPDEGLGRRFDPNRDNNDRLPTLPTGQRRGHQHRQRDDEFGAVEKNLHNQRSGDRRLPDDDY